MDKQFLKDIAPYIGPYIIILGVLKLNAFYSYFGINVLQYLEPSEALFVFVPSFLQLFIILGIGFVAGLLNYWLAPHTFRGMFDERTIGIWTVFVIAVFNLMALWVYFFEHQNRFVMAISSSFLILLQAGAVATFVRTGKRRKDFLVIATAILTACFFYLGGLTDALDTKPFPTERLCIYYTDNTDIMAGGDSISYLGKTKNYLFFFNWKDKRPEVVSASKLDRIEGFSDRTASLLMAW
jgi:hypothetical protein